MLQINYMKIINFLTALMSDAAVVVNLQAVMSKAL